ncbi:MAG: hypothetical protein JST89_22485 [Cyanobacteria bacterium SZAS-4]|nr:hypothetical protein [Cyanobacteria bacterium SZAS-4]
MFERFSETLIKSIIVAQEEAHALGWFVVGTEFLLLGLLSTSEGIAARALKSQGVNFLDAKLAVQKKVGRGPGSGLHGTKFTPSAKTLLKNLALRAKVNNENISSRHLLLALLEIQNESVKPLGALEILREIKVDVRKLQSELLQVDESKIDMPLPPDILPKPYDPTDDALTLEQKIVQWEAEAELCRRVEREALIQADLCRKALADIIE